MESSSPDMNSQPSTPPSEDATAAVDAGEKAPAGADSTDGGKHVS